MQALVLTWQVWGQGHPPGRSRMGPAALFTVMKALLEVHLPHTLYLFLLPNMLSLSARSSVAREGSNLYATRLCSFSPQSHSRQPLFGRCNLAVTERI